MAGRKNRMSIESLEDRCLLSSALPPAGTVQTFTGGQTVISQSGTPGSPPTFSAVAEGPDGRLITADDDGNSVSISRYLSSGAVDTTFGSDGTITLTSLDVSKVIIDPDATILLVGSKIQRLTYYGSPDDTFDGGGAVTLPFTATGAAVESDGDILVAGGSGTSAAVFRFTTAGALDSTFGTGGKLTIPDPAGTVVVGGIAVDPEGGSVVSVGFDNGPDVLGVYRLTETGQIDTSFGYDGLATTTGLAALPTPGQIAVTSDDAYIYQVGTYSAGTADSAAYAVSYSTNDSDGTGASETPLPLGIGNASDMVVLGDDELVVAGWTSVAGTPAVKQEVVARYEPLTPDDLELTPDGSFGTGGATLLSYASPASSTSDQTAGQGNSAWSIALGTNGTIAVGGTTVEPAHGSTAAVAKFDLSLLSADPGTVESQGAISGTVFGDTNGDGIQESGEPGLPNYGLFLDYNGDGTFDAGDVRVVTDATGHYQFLGLAPGTYTVTENLSAGQGHSQPLDSNSYTVTVKADATVTGGGFGVVTASGTITGTLFDDVNGSGAYESTDPPLAGWGCYLDLNDDGVFDDSDVREYANASGIVTFSGLAAGTYYIEQNTPAGYQRTTPKTLPIVITLAQGGVATFAIGDQPIATAKKGTGVVKGVVFDDEDANGAQSATEPGLASRTVYADISDSGIQNSSDPATVTSSNGTFTLTGLASGPVVIREVLPAGWRQTTPGPGLGIRVTITGTTPITGLVFGATNTAEITGTVFTDTNGNGVQNTGEVGTNNVRVYIDQTGKGTYVTGDPSAVTNSSGVFVLNAVAAGTYKIGIVVPTGSHQTTPADGAELTVKVTAGQVSTGSLFGVS